MPARPVITEETLDPKIKEIIEADVAQHREARVRAAVTVVNEQAEMDWVLLNGYRLVCVPGDKVRFTHQGESHTGTVKSVVLRTCRVIVERTVLGGTNDFLNIPGEHVLIAKMGGYLDALTKRPHVGQTYPDANKAMADYLASKALEPA